MRGHTIISSILPTYLFKFFKRTAVSVYKCYPSFFTVHESYAKLNKLYVEIMPPQIQMYPNFC